MSKASKGKAQTSTPSSLDDAPRRSPPASEEAFLYPPDAVYDADNHQLIIVLQTHSFLSSAANARQGSATAAQQRIIGLGGSVVRRNRLEDLNQLLVKVAHTAAEAKAVADRARSTVEALKPTTILNLSGDTFRGETATSDDQTVLGVREYKAGGVYEGEFLNGMAHGVGQSTHNEHNIYLGNFRRDQRDGLGCLTWSKDDSSFFGEWKDGLRHGVGVMTFTSVAIPGYKKGVPCRGLTYMGEWRLGKMCGQGRIHDTKTGALLLGGIFKDDAVEREE